MKINLFFFFLFVACPFAAFSEGRLGNVSLYSGIAISDPLQNMINLKPPNFKEVGILVLSGAFPLAARNRVRIEAELQFGRSFEEKPAYQFNPVFQIRLTQLPWDRYLPSSFALGNGLSFSSKVSSLEADDGLTQRLLYYVSLEFDFRIRRESPFSGFTRVHHRSGIFGLFGDSGGTNFMTLGIRYSF